MDKAAFDQLAQQGYNRIPIMIEVLADLDTPLSTYIKLASGANSFLFESVQGGEKWGRYSIIGLPCHQSVRIVGKEVRFFEGSKQVSSLQVEDPLTWVEEFRQQFKVPVLDNLPRFSGGLVGYFGYDTIRYIEPKLTNCPNPDPLGTPDILLMLSEEVVVFDNLAGKIQLIVHADPSQAQAFEQAQSRLAQLARNLRKCEMLYAQESQSLIDETDFVSGFTQEGFEAAVNKCKQYIVDGDVMQVVLSQRLSIPFPIAPLNLYRALRSINPSPYLFFLDFGDFQVAGSSPEILVRQDADEITVRPIAGTRPRGKTPEQDIALEKELLADPKEIAEHLMLIDLGRNDIGRVAKIGSVRVTEKMLIERYSHVMHIVSNVTGTLNQQQGPMDVLRATFPAGTLSGAPKVRAMEIIDELEPVKRGIYGGAIGYLSWSGNMDTAIAIRTAVIKDGQLHIQAGAGIVADSIPLNEWEETMNKARAVFRAASFAARGLDEGGLHR